MEAPCKYTSSVTVETPVILEVQRDCEGRRRSDFEIQQGELDCGRTSKNHKQKQSEGQKEVL